MLLMVGIGAIPAKKGTRDNRTIVESRLYGQSRYEQKAWLA